MAEVFSEDVRTLGEDVLCVRMKSSRATWLRCLKKPQSGSLLTRARCRLSPQQDSNFILERNFKSRRTALFHLPGTNQPRLSTANIHHRKIKAHTHASRNKIIKRHEGREISFFHYFPMQAVTAGFPRVNEREKKKKTLNSCVLENEWKKFLFPFLML